MSRLATCRRLTMRAQLALPVFMDTGFRRCDDAGQAAARFPPMKVSEFDFDLPPHLIADRPAVPRDSARLLEVAERLTDHVVRDLPTLLHPGDLLVFNDTRVIPA